MLGVAFSIIASKSAMKGVIRCVEWMMSGIFHVLTAEDISHVSLKQAKLMIC